VGLLGAEAVAMSDRWTTYDWGSQAQSFVLTLWLTVGTLPFVAWLSLFSTYEQALLHMESRDGSRAPLKARLALVVAFRARARRELHRFVGFWPRKLAEAGGFRAGLAVIGDFRAELRAQDAAEQERAEDLVRYAGVPGTDGEGRQLDRREFDATRQALEWLATVQAGAYHRDQRYDDDALKVFQPGFARGLPDEHGITMKVRQDGQAWFGWRRTITGWVFAVGSEGPPPRQWFYDGPEPPRGYPMSDSGWPTAPFDRGANWSGLP
jgi:hypothetical protein